MSIRLHTHGKPLAVFRRPVIGKVVLVPRESHNRGDYILVQRELPAEVDIKGYLGILIEETVSQEVPGFSIGPETPLIHSVAVDHLEDGDIIGLNPSGYIRTLYRISSPHNSIFTTDRCNSFCLMCSQPPKSVDDSDRIKEHLRLIELMDPGTSELGITGGEPSLLKDDLLLIVQRCKEILPSTALHILSNGRLFYYGPFARKLAEIEHPDLMIGIPLYSDVDAEHDFVVQSAGAFDETIIGMQNLGRYGVQVEVRVVLHRYTCQRLPQVAEFIYRNIPFAAHVALMGLEVMGFALPNLDDLWVDPYCYRSELRDATLFLARRGMNVSVYNHQLCIVPKEIWGYCRKSISDWKNDYLPGCEGCAELGSCGGFFSSSLRRRFSNHIAPILG